MNFSYVAFDRAGKAARGAVDAASEPEARENLRARGLFVTEVAAATNAAPALPGKVSPLSRFGGGKGRRLRNLVTFTRQTRARNVLAVKMQVDGQPAVTLTAGQTFYENPTDVHRVSANASTTQPAKILVFMVKDKDKAATKAVAASK